MTAATAAALESLDPVDPRRAPAPVMLVIDRVDLPMARQMADGWRKQGADLQYESSSDGEQLLKSPNLPDLPARIMMICNGWLDRWGGPVGAVATGSEEQDARQPPACSAAFTIAGRQVIEEVRRYGPGQQFGIASLPGHGTQAAGSGGRRTGVLLLNSGAVHHVGPSRLYVSLARSWASQGLVVMRVDLPGIGESPPRAGLAENIVYAEGADAGVLEAVRELRSKYCVTDVVSIGVCSGAYYSFLAAKNQDGLRGVVLINPLTFYQTAGMALDEGDMSPRAAEAAIEAARYGKSIRNWQTWKKAFSGKVDLTTFARTMLRRILSHMGSALRELRRALRLPIPNDLPSDLRRIHQRGVAVAMIFSSHDLGLPRTRLLGGWSLQRMLRTGQVEMHVIDGADHTFMQLKHRRLLQDVLSAVVRRITG